MTVTRLKRKDRRNLARAVNKTRIIKQLLTRPVIKQVNIEELKAKYGTGATAPVASAQAAAPVAVPVQQKEVVAPVQQKEVVVPVQHEEVAAPAQQEEVAVPVQQEEEKNAAPVMSAGDMNA